MSTSDLKVCPHCNQAVGAWRPQCDCGHKFGDSDTSREQELDDLIRSIEGASSAPHSRSLEGGNARGHSELNRPTENSRAQRRYSAKPPRTTAFWLRVSAVATIVAVGIAFFQYGPSEKSRALIHQAQSLTDAAQANYERALTNRETCELVVRARSEHQRIEEQANSTIMEQDVYSRDKGVKDAWNTAASRIDDFKDRLQTLVARCDR